MEIPFFNVLLQKRSPHSTNKFASCRKRRRENTCDLVFKSKAGTPIESGHLRRSFRLALKKARIEDFHFHDLRHTFATRLIQGGVELYKVQRLLGHKSPIMTQRYAHHHPESLRDGVKISVLLVLCFPVLSFPFPPSLVTKVVTQRHPPSRVPCSPLSPAFSLPRPRRSRLEPHSPASCSSTGGIVPPTWLNSVIRRKAQGNWDFWSGP